MQFRADKEALRASVIDKRPPAVMAHARVWLTRRERYLLAVLVTLGVMRHVVKVGTCK